MKKKAHIIYWALLILGLVMLAGCHPLRRAQSVGHAAATVTEATLALASDPVLDAGATLTTKSTPRTAPPGSEVEVKPGVTLQIARAFHTATRLADGRILLAGGSQSTDEFPLAVDAFDPTTGLTRQVAPLHAARHGHSATLLADGRVLVIGGYNLPQQWLSDAEVYDPQRDAWTTVSPRYSHGLTHSATVMEDGRVLVVGGGIGSGRSTDRVEIFDPQTNGWTEAQPLPADRANHTAQLLADGRVLVAGGWGGANTPIGGDALLYDPQADTWTATGPMVEPRIWAQSVRLADGRVLVVGGITQEDQYIPTISASAEIYDPASNTWTAALDMAQPRYSHFLVLRPDGQVWAFGGARDWDCCYTNDSFVREIELYDPVANQWRTVGELPQPRAQASVALLPDGRVWLTGGRVNGQPDALHFADTWLIGP